MKDLSIKIGLIFLFGIVSLSLQANQIVLDCEVFFTYQDYDGTTPVTGGITFVNQSTGDYTNIAWDFGDDNFSNDSSDSLDYFYANDGVYNVCLSVWNDQGCFDTFCSDVIVGDLSDICNLTDCVFPGDANKDGNANFYDLLELGIGNGTTGPERPNATTEWAGQLAPDWAASTLNGINFKHLDCDGNGIIDENDAIAITDNYQVMDAPNPTTEASAPLIYIEFDQDTIFVDDNLLASDIEIIAHLKVGNQDFPAQNIYGLAMYLSYPSDLVYEDSISFEYHANSFFGTSNEVFWLPNNQYDEEQIDIGITRKDASSSTGFGEVGKTVFIIEADIIDGRVENGDVHFPVSVNGVKMIDADGNELPINLTNTPTTLVFTKAPETTGTNNLQLAQEIQVFPNPASEKINIDLGNLNGIQLQVFNNFGQILLEKNISPSKIELNVKDWNTGVYFVKIKTEKGVVSKRFVLK